MQGNSTKTSEARDPLHPRASGLGFRASGDLGFKGLWGLRVLRVLDLGLRIGWVRGLGDDPELPDRRRQETPAPQNKHSTLCRQCVPKP